MNVSIAQERDLEEWQAFVDRHDRAGPLHHAGWYRVLRQAYAVEPVFFIARSARGDVAGILPGYRSRSIFTGGHYTSLEGGILADDADAVKALFEKAVSLRDQPGVAYVQIRGGAGTDAEAPYRVPTVHTVLPTARGPQASWDAIKPKTRWGIRQAEKEEYQVELDAELARLNDFYRLYAAHMHELGTPVFGLRTLVAMRAHLGRERLRLYHLRYRGDLVGGMLCVVHGNRWTDLYAIVRRSQTTEFANYLLYWHVVRDAAAAGVDEFDLGRSTPGSGVHLFKRKWGGRDVDVPYLFFPSSKSKNGKHGLLGETREKGLRQRVWSKLPLPLCNAVGPILRRQLPFL